MTESQEKVTGIMKLKPSNVAPHVVVVGDPARARYLASLMDTSELVAENREYVTYTGTYKGTRVTVASHGVGGGGASMAFEELIQAGAKVIIRAGTCGSLQPEYREGNFIVVTGAVRCDGVTDRLVPLGYPAVANYEVVEALVNTLKNTDDKFGVGLCVTEGTFYDGPLGNNNALWRDAKAKAIEMEASVLFVIASIRGIKAGAILNVDNYIFERLEEGEYKPHREIVVKGNEKMCKYALDAVISVPL